jgi:hypothetical protein
MTERATSRGEVVCVTGMHRSGTSFATRALELLGVSLGRGDGLLPPGPDNPAGYFENKAIQELDDELLAHLGGSWDRPPLLPQGWADDPSLDAFRERAGAVVARDFGDDLAAGHVVGFKDPRLSVLLPFWRSVVDVRTTVVLVRAPGEVAASLAERNGLAPAQSSLLWLRYTLAAVADDPTHLLVTLDDLVRDLPGTLTAIAAHLGLDAPTDAVTTAVGSHFDAGLRHHDAEERGAREVASDPLSALAEAVWDGGRPDPSRIEPTIARALAEGWLRAPGDDDELARARAEAVSFKEQLKRRNEVVKALKEGRPPPAPLPETPVVDVDAAVGDGG